ncbi:MAG: Mur ligase family protein, partial [Bdellovibrionota bacterium]
MKRVCILDIIQKLKLLEAASITTNDEITRVTSTLENAGPQDLVIYNLKENDDKSQTLFLERFSKSRCNNFILPCAFSFPRPVNIIISKEFFEKKPFVELCDLIFGREHDGPVKIVAITGTNGKSSTVFFLNQLANLLEIKAASLGTIGLYIGTEKIRNSLLTTPDYFELRETLQYLATQKIEYLFLEASSHALEQDRFLDIRFQSAGWTNLTHDHLDYHGNFSNYFSAKLKILRNLSTHCKLVISPDSSSLFHQILGATPSDQNRILLADKLSLNQQLPAFLKVEFN